MAIFFHTVRIDDLGNQGRGLGGLRQWLRRQDLRVCAGRGFRGEFVQLGRHERSSRSVVGVVVQHFSDHLGDAGDRCEYPRPHPIDHVLRQ